MNKEIKKLEKLQKKIHSSENENAYFDETLVFCEINGFLRIRFYGLPWGTSFIHFSEWLSDKNFALRVESLQFDSPDEGANGTNNYDFSSIAESQVLFPNLKNFIVKINEPIDHNRTIIGEYCDEDGQIAKLLRKMPNLLSLQVPSAPNSDFFNLGKHPLEILIVQAGYDTQNFILNFSKSDCFDKLRFFDFTDYEETYIEGWEDDSTPFEDFTALFKSKAFDSVKMVILRSLTLTKKQTTKLKSLRKNITFKFIRTESYYV